MTGALDIYCAARILVKEYGPREAPLMAARRADALIGRGDVDGQRVWEAVLRAVIELLRRERRPDERVN